MKTKRHIMTFSKDSVKSESFSELDSNKRLYVITSDVTYDKSKTPSKHISLGGFKSLYEDLTYTEENFGEISGGKFISSISIYYFDESVNGFRKLVIHNSPTLLADLESFISSLEGSTKNTTVIVIFNGSGLSMKMDSSKVDTCVFARYGTSFPLAILKDDVEYPKNADGSMIDFEVSYIMVMCARSKNGLFDAFQAIPRGVYDSTITSTINKRKELLNELYIKLNEDKIPVLDTSNKTTAKETITYLNHYGLSVGKISDDMVQSTNTDTSLIASFGKDIKYYKEYIEIENSR